mmetsp:Transcript_41654/g.97482  ORF Transcript_41654/g.97482 Transcript_41654/m.97482 type:complete len:270 (-) Transcript_41654:193-1002(-)
MQEDRLEQRECLEHHARPLVGPQHVLPDGREDNPVVVLAVGRAAQLVEHGRRRHRRLVVCRVGELSVELVRREERLHRLQLLPRGSGVIRRRLVHGRHHRAQPVGVRGGRLPPALARKPEVVVGEAARRLLLLRPLRLAAAALHVGCRDAAELVLRGLGLLALRGEHVLAVEQLHNLPRFLAHILPLILAVSIDVVKLLQPLELSQMVACVFNDSLGAVAEQIIEHTQGLVYDTPQRARQLQVLPHVIHHRLEIIVAERRLRYLREHCA